MTRFISWLAVDLLFCTALMLWAGVEGWRAMAVAIAWNVAGYVQGRISSRMEAR